MKYDRAKFFSDLKIKRVDTPQLKAAIELHCPFDSSDIIGKERTWKLMYWRAGIAVSWWIQVLSLQKAARKVNISHYSLMNYLDNLAIELELCDYRITDKIRLINFYAARMTKKCNETKFELICGKK